jgi:tetratricopeptide (TPR) repeat protein
VAVLWASSWAEPASGSAASAGPGRAGIVAQEVLPAAGQAPWAPAPAEFVGAEVCGECHEENYSAWSGSTHGRAGGPPGPESVIAPFDGTPIRFADAEVVPSVTSQGEYRFRVRREGRNDLVYRVDGVIGRGHMVGGGTQGFVSRQPDGTVRFLPFDYSQHEDRWFCNTARIAGWWTPGGDAGRPYLDEGWVPITEELRLADCGDWPPVRVLGTDLRFANCQGCHGSQITLTQNPAQGMYETSVGSLTINCESCHGPGREHVDRARVGAISDGVDPGIDRLDLMDEDGSLEVCFRCHALKRALQPGYLPGADFGAHYSLLLPELGDRPYYPDGRVRTFAYQLTHRQSACYLDGAMTCVDCHDPHGQGYRDVAAAPIPDRFDDGQCVGCHASKAGDVSEHTGHEVDSEGSRCVACHMPYLQQPELGSAIRYARSDHTIPLPRPGFDESLGVSSACTLCHADRSPAELAEWSRTQWGEMKPHDAVETALLAAERTGVQGTSTAQARALLQAEHPNSMALVAAMNHLTEGYLQPNMAALDAEVEAALRRLALHQDPDVQAVALASLHMARGDAPEVRAFLTAQVDSMGESRPLVLPRWVGALRFLADRYRRRGDPVSALEVARKGLEIAPGAPGVLLDMGGLFDAVGDPIEAGEYYRRSLEADPEQSVAWVNLGRTLEAAGDIEQAARAYEQALSVYSGEGLAHMNLGNLLLARGDYAGAMDWYRRAVAAEPGLTGAWFNLAIAYMGLELSDQAASALRSVLELDPGDAEALELLSQLQGGGP